RRRGRGAGRGARLRPRPRRRGLRLRARGMSLAIRARTEERMDDPSLPAADYAAVLADLAQVNRVTFAARPTLSFLARGLRGRDRFRLLDVGFGEGDMLRRIARWAARRGIAADLVGVDLNPNSAPAARAATPAGIGAAI